MKNQLSQLIKQLVAFKSVGENAEEKRKIINFCQNWFGEAEIETELYDHNPDAPSLLAILPGEKKETILWLAHLDVVPAPEDMFAVRQEDDILHGRGVIDDKGPVAMFMVLAERLKEEKNRPTIKILFTTDEETGGTEAGRLAEMGVVGNIDALFVPDGGAWNTLVCKEKGILHLVLESKGKAVHGSRPWLGENAINKIWSAYEAICEIFEDADLDAPFHWHPTVNIGRIGGGDAINKVPDKAEMGVDIRFTEKYSLSDLEEKIRQKIAGKAEIVKINKGELLDSEEDHPLIKKYIKIMEQEIGEKIKIEPEHGASDARHFNNLNIPIWLHYPKGGGHHTDDEWVDVSSLEKMALVMEKFLFSV